MRSALLALLRTCHVRTHTRAREARAVQIKLVTAADGPWCLDSVSSVCAPTGHQRPLHRMREPALALCHIRRVYMGCTSSLTPSARFVFPSHRCQLYQSLHSGSCGNYRPNDIFIVDGCCCCCCCASPRTYSAAMSALVKALRLRNMVLRQPLVAFFDVFLSDFRERLCRIIWVRLRACLKWCLDAWRLWCRSVR